MSTTLPTRVGVVGGGRMGSGIAHAFLVAGCSVQIVEPDPAGGERAATAVRRAVGGSAQRGTLTGTVHETLARLDILPAAGHLDHPGLLIEAVPEIVDLKLAVLGQVAETVADTTVIATNTSSFSVTELAAAIDTPGRFLGLHFFNPVPASKLVEVVVAAGTDAAVVTRAQQWVTALGKTAVTVRDSPGFASSRLGLALGLEAIRMVQDDVAPAADIDTAMTLGYGHPMGPLRLTDVVGLDIRLGIAEYLAARLGPRFEPPQLLKDMVSRGDLGRKSGRGFFRWNE